MQSALRTLSLSYNLLRGATDWNKHDHIISGLFLGMIPIKNTSFGEDFSNSDETIIQFVKQVNPTRPLKLIVSVIEPDELLGKGFAGVTMVSPDDWKNHGIEQLTLPMGDFKSSVDPEAAIQTIEKMRQCIASGHSVYVHCKAGRSRSTMICAIFLASSIINPETNKKFTLSEAICLLKEARTQIEVGNDKIKTAENIIQQLENLTETSLISDANTPAMKLTALLSSPTTKEAIMSLECIKALEHYAKMANLAKSPPYCKRSDCIYDFISLIIKPLSEQWFFTLYNQAGPLQKFIKTNPTFDTSEEKAADAAQRMHLVQQAKLDIINYIATTLNITPETLDSLCKTE